MPSRLPKHRPSVGASQSASRSAYERGYDRRWQKYRVQFLSCNPLCVECERQGRLIASTDVDHITAVVGGQSDPLFWDRTNHQALCHECHSRKTAREWRRKTTAY